MTEMKNISFLITAALLCVAPLAAQEVEVPVTETVSPSSELAEKFTNALLGSQWKSSLEVVAESPEGGVTISFDISMQDITHFSIAATMTSEDPFEGETVQNHKIMCDGEFLYADIEGVAELSQGMINGPIKVKLSEILKMAGVEELPTAEMIAPMVAGLLGAVPLAEEGSTDELRRYAASSEEEGSMTVCFHASTFLLASAEGKRPTGEMFTITTKDTAVVEEFAEGTFVYDKEAQDITAMLQMMSGGPGAGAPADDDLEF
jgi:hypothetical protein